MTLKREQILQANDTRTIDVDVPEWGGIVKIKLMDGEARQAWQESIATTKGKLPKNMMETLLVLTLVDDSGEPLFSLEDVKALSKKSSIVLSRLWEEAAELNGLTDRSIKAMEKN